MFKAPFPHLHWRSALWPDCRDRKQLFASLPSCTDPSLLWCFQPGSRSPKDGYTINKAWLTSPDWGSGSGGLPKMLPSCPDASFACPHSIAFRCSYEPYDTRRCKAQLSAEECPQKKEIFRHTKKKMEDKIMPGEKRLGLCLRTWLVKRKNTKVLAQVRHQTHPHAGKAIFAAVVDMFTQNRNLFAQSSEKTPFLRPCFVYSLFLPYCSKIPLG